MPPAHSCKSLPELGVIRSLPTGVPSGPFAYLTLFRRSSACPCMDNGLTCHTIFTTCTPWLVAHLQSMR